MNAPALNTLLSLSCSARGPEPAQGPLLRDRLLAAWPRLLNRSRPWVHVPHLLRESGLEPLKQLAVELIANSEVLLILGPPDLERSARALCQALPPPAPTQARAMRFLSSRWASPHRLPRLLEELAGARVSLVLLMGEVIDPIQATCLPLLREHLVARHGLEEADRRTVIACTSSDSPAPASSPDPSWRRLCPSARLPGPYHALSPALLLPLALTGTDPGPLLEGARSMARSLSQQPEGEHPLMDLALARAGAWARGIREEWISSPDPALADLTELLCPLLHAPQAAVPTPRAVPWSELEEATSRATTWGGAELSLTLLHALPPASPDRAGPWWELTRMTPLLEQRLRPAWEASGWPVQDLTLRRLDPFHLGALLLFLQALRGITDDVLRLDAPSGHTPGDGALTPGPSAPTNRSAGGTD